MNTVRKEKQMDEISFEMKQALKSLHETEFKICKKNLRFHEERNEQINR